MSKSYSHRYTRRYSRNDDQAGFILIILIGGTAWSHRDLLPTVEHWAMIALAITVIAILAVWARRIIQHLNVRHREKVFDVTGVDAMDGLEFERYIARLLETKGYGAVRLTEKFDYGVDIMAIKDGVTWGIQVKRYSGLVGVEAVRQVVTALRKYHCDRSMVITNSIFSQIAKDLAESNDCLLIDRKILSSWIIDTRR